MKQNTDTAKCLKILQRVGLYGIHSFHLGQEVGTIRIAARINDLKKLGYTIHAEPETLGNARGVRYTLGSSPVKQILEKPVYKFDPVRQVYVLL